MIYHNNRLTIDKKILNMEGGRGEYLKKIETLEWFANLSPHEYSIFFFVYKFLLNLGKFSVNFR
jgi:hypothetical protein